MDWIFTLFTLFSNTGEEYYEEEVDVYDPATGLTARVKVISGPRPR